MLRDSCRLLHGNWRVSADLGHDCYSYRKDFFFCWLLLLALENRRQNALSMPAGTYRMTAGADRVTAGVCRVTAGACHMTGGAYRVTAGTYRVTSHCHSTQLRFL